MQDMEGSARLWDHDPRQANIGAQDLRHPASVFVFNFAGHVVFNYAGHGRGKPNQKPWISPYWDKPSFSLPAFLGKPYYAGQVAGQVVCNYSLTRRWTSWAIGISETGVTIHVFPQQIINFYLT